MISIHDIKDGLIIFGLVIYLGWGLFKRVREDFRKEFLHHYQYSVPFKSRIVTHCDAFFTFNFFQEVIYKDQYKTWPCHFRDGLLGT